MLDAIAGTPGAFLLAEHMDFANDYCRTEFERQCDGAFIAGSALVELIFSLPHEPLSWVERAGALPWYLAELPDANQVRICRVAGRREWALSLYNLDQFRSRGLSYPLDRFELWLPSSAAARRIVEVCYRASTGLVSMPEELRPYLRWMDYRA